MTALAMAQRMDEHGVRPTQQRMAVYRYLMEHKHPSAEEVYGALSKEHPTFSRTTVYNSLHALVMAGLVLELSPGTEEKRYDAGTKLHGHFRCLSCGCILDVPLDAAAIRGLWPTDCRVEREEITFSGRCAACADGAAHDHK